MAYFRNAKDLGPHHKLDEARKGSFLEASDGGQPSPHPDFGLRVRK